MRSSLTFLFMLMFIITTTTIINAQTFDGEWSCDYATYDTSVDDNAIAQSCVSVAAIKENTFVALSHRVASAILPSTNFLVGYTDADSANGRMGLHYGNRGDRQMWINGFDQVEMMEAMDLAATPDSFIYVANNDPERNILVFKMGADSVEPAPFRLISGADSLWAIHVDSQGRVYVASIKPTSEGPSEILIFDSIQNDPSWSNPPFTATPLQTITLPDTGTVRGITSIADGSILYITNFESKKVYCYTGSPESGYSLYPGFNINFSDPRLIDDSTETLDPGPWGITYLNDKNILAFAADVSFRLGVAYQYGKMFFANPNTGEYLDTIDVAKWNFDMTGAYSSRSGGNSPGNASGYTSTYNVSFDANDNIYSQSYYGWTVEKWSYSGTLPTIPLTIVGVEKDENIVPDNFTLSQNYPNPFNPSTTIEFAVPTESKISLAVYNINGELVTQLINSQTFSSGTYKLTFDASKLASGTYLYVLRSNDQQFSRKMTLIK